MACPLAVTCFLVTDITLRMLVVVFAKPYWDADVCDEDTLVPWAALALFELQLLGSIYFVEVYCRWEKQRHVITLWQITSALVLYLLQSSIVVHPMLYANAVLLLLGVFYAGCMADFRQTTPVRVPPFPEKQDDVDKPNHGWLGPWVATRIKSRVARHAIVLPMFVSNLQEVIVPVLVARASGQHYDLSGDVRKLHALVFITIMLLVLLAAPSLCTGTLTAVSLYNDCKSMKASCNSYRVGPYEVCSIDEDAHADCELNIRLRTHQCRSLTVVIPCYMPNEEGIIADVIDYYRSQKERYPGELRLMIVWNSPRDHPHFEDMLAAVRVDCPWITAHRNLRSTSKCDNLNMACHLLKTDFCLLNDADTIVSAASMCRASMLIFDAGYDIAQCHLTHCFPDAMGKPESGCFPAGALVTLLDSSKNPGCAVQDLFRHQVFDGRGGFWRTTAVKLVGFDHRTVGEDHDAGYRAISYFGCKGIMDINLICQERTPPTLNDLTRQRIRWATSGLEMRRNCAWMLRSEHYTSFEAFVTICIRGLANVPLQSVPLRIAEVYLFSIVINYTRYLFGEPPSSPCAPPDEAGNLQRSRLIVGNAMLFAALIIVLIIPIIHGGLVLLLRTCTTRYRPRCLFLVALVFAEPIWMLSFGNCTQYFAFYDYCWGTAKFVCTARSQLSSTLSTTYASLPRHHT